MSTTLEAATVTVAVFRYALLAAAGVYALALVFRALDQEVCSALPIGTHFLWHSLSGLTAYLAMRCLVLSRAARQASARAMAPDAT